MMISRSIPGAGGRPWGGTAADRQAAELERENEALRREMQRMSSEHLEQIAAMEARLSPNLPGALEAAELKTEAEKLRKSNLVLEVQLKEVTAVDDLEMERLYSLVNELRTSLSQATAEAEKEKANRVGVDDRLQWAMKLVNSTQTDQDNLKSANKKLEQARDAEVAGKVNAEKERKKALEDKKKAEKERKVALEEKTKAEKERNLALEDKKKAEKERNVALEDKKKAEKERTLALESKKKAEREKTLALEGRKKAEKERDHALAQCLQASMAVQVPPPEAAPAGAKRQRITSAEPPATDKQQEPVAAVPPAQLPPSEPDSTLEKAMAKMEKKMLSLEGLSKKVSNVLSLEGQIKRMQSIIRCLAPEHAPLLLLAVNAPKAVGDLSGQLNGLEEKLKAMEAGKVAASLEQTKQAQGLTDLTAKVKEMEKQLEGFKTGQRAQQAPPPDSAKDPTALNPKSATHSAGLPKTGSHEDDPQSAGGRANSDPSPRINPNSQFNLLRTSSGQAQGGNTPGANHSSPLARPPGTARPPPQQQGFRAAPPHLGGATLGSPQGSGFHGTPLAHATRDHQQRPAMQSSLPPGFSGGQRPVGLGPGPSTLFLGGQVGATPPHLQQQQQQLAQQPLQQQQLLIQQQLQPPPQHQSGPRAPYGWGVQNFHNSG